VLERAHRALEKITGKAPLGWRAPLGLLSPATLGYLCELGYRYDASFQDDDYPYVMDCGAGRTIVELPSFRCSTIRRCTRPATRLPARSRPGRKSSTRCTTPER
jgi:peptidoglycan/xylan/chitin deacetylase (PgdA/CDA1 family)